MQIKTKFQNNSIEPILTKKKGKYKNNTKREEEKKGNQFHNNFLINLQQNHRQSIKKM